MTDKRVSCLIAAHAIALWLSEPAAAAASTQKRAASAAEEARIAHCIRAAAGGRAWLEKTLWGLRDQEGGWIGADVANKDGSHDLGPLQVNSWWVDKIANITRRSPKTVRWWLANDACFNVSAARWIFLTGLASTGEYWKAIGAYHSPTAWRQKRYAASVSSHLKRRYGPQVFTAAKPVARK